MPPEEEEDYWEHDTRQDRTAHWAHHPSDSGHCVPVSELCDSSAPDPADERMQVQQQQQASAYHRRLMEREAKLATAELRRLDEQYPVWGLGYDVLDWSRQRCAYITTGDPVALLAMTGYVSADSPALWEVTDKMTPYRRARPWGDTRLHEIGRALRSWWWLDSPAGMITAIVLLLALIMIPLAIVT
jgi:hypothetical protein